MRIRHLLPILFTCVAFGGSCPAWADEAMAGSGAQPARDFLPSIKQYDSRLPPVLPGEDIVTESGKKMKVWSSAGPVPINQPTPPQYPGGGSGYYGGFPPVIVNDPGFRGPGGPGGPGGLGGPGGIGEGGGLAPLAAPGRAAPAGHIGR